MFLLVVLFSPALYPVGAWADDTAESPPDVELRRESSRVRRAQRASRQIGEVERIFGVSRIQRDGRESNIAMGERVFEGDKFRTGNSRLTFRFKDGSQLGLAEDSALEIERIRFHPPNPLPANKAATIPDESVYRFTGGLLRVTVTQLPESHRYIIKTDHALFEVREPVEFYLLRTPGKRDLSLKVSTGKLIVVSVVSNDRTEVKEKSSVTIKASGAISDAGPISPGMLGYLEGRTRL